MRKLVALSVLAAACATAPQHDRQQSAGCAERIAAELGIGTLPAAPASEGMTVDSPPGVVAPRVIERVEPQVPREMLGQGGRRSATVDAVIRADGTVGTVCVVSGDPRWGRVLQDAVRRWRFAPATKDGEPVAVRFSVTSTLSAH